MTGTEAAIQHVDCCPELAECAVCDVLDFGFRLPFRPVVGAAAQRQAIAVEVTLRFRLTRCAGPLSLGDILYSTTLLPGEEVRLFTSDRHSRFSFDSETHLAYRHQTTSEESFYMAGMANAVNNISVNENAAATSSFHSSSIGGGGGLGIDLGFLSLGGSVSGSSHDARSASSFAQHLSQHADSSSRHVEVGARAASSTAVGEVATRAHSEGESEDHFESASRVFENPNHCHALTFLFYKLNKCQTIRWELIGIDRRVDDPAAPTGVVQNNPAADSKVSVLPDAVLATSQRRFEVERQADALATERFASTAALSVAAAGRQGLFGAAAAEALAATARDGALKSVDEQLVKEGLLDKVGGEVSEQARAQFGWERQIALPTAGVIVKACLDDCEACEPARRREVELDLPRRALENALLKRQIELLDKAQEYRCCPEDDDVAGGS
jgi:hypothetical protein